MYIQIPQTQFLYTIFHIDLFSPVMEFSNLSITPFYILSEAKNVLVLT